MDPVLVTAPSAPVLVVLSAVVVVARLEVTGLSLAWDLECEIAELAMWVSRAAAAVGLLVSR